MTFKEYLDEVNESAGNLKGIPRNFIKAITGYEGKGGKNSKLILDTKKAKRADLTKLVKKVGGWVDKKYVSYYGMSPQEKEAILMKDNYAGVLVKIDGSWEYYITYEEYVEKGQHFKVMSKDDTWVKGYKAMELNDLIDFKNSNVELYIVTKDKDRLELQKERRVGKDITDNMSKVKEKAFRKYIISKSNGVYDILRQKLKEAQDKLSKDLEKYTKDIFEGKPTSFKLEDSLKDFKTISDELEKLNMYINSMSLDYVKFNEKPSDSFYSKYFEKFIKETKQYLEEQK